MANLQPLYDVKERLEHAAIAGTGLLAEDFRLKRAAEALAPLAKASPVFAKIEQGVRDLLAAPAEGRGGALLDTLALVDAVAYTQGTAGGQGELVPLAPGRGVCLPLSYGQLHPLMEALTGTGGGRFNQIQDAWENHPEYFSDFRVIPLLIKGLGDSYAELADLNLRILKAQGPGVIPLLKEGFDPAGKQDMARRAELIDHLAGAAENDFYLAQLESAKKPVRGALLYALRHDPANGKYLAELCQTERGGHQEAARWALARSKAPEAWDYWHTLAEKDPDKVLDFMRCSQTEAAQDLTAVLFTETMERLRENPGLPLDQPLWERVNRLRLALEGKEGPDIADCYRQAAALGQALDRKMTDGKDFAFVTNGSQSRPFSEVFPVTLFQSLLKGADLCDLAEELWEKHGGLYAAPALCAALLGRDSGEAFRRAKEILGGPLMLLQKERRAEILRLALWGLLWDKEKGRYEYSVASGDPSGLESGVRRVPLAAPLDEGWYDLLMKTGEADMTLRNIFNPEREELKGRLGEHFYRQAARGKDPLAVYIQLLVQCGWTRWADLLPQRAKRCGELKYYTYVGLLRTMPIPDRERAAELRKLDQLARDYFTRIRGEANVRRDWPEAQAKRQIAQWEEEA